MFKVIVTFSKICKNILPDFKCIHLAVSFCLKINHMVYLLVMSYIKHMTTLESYEIGYLYIFIAP